MHRLLDSLTYRAVLLLQNHKDVKLQEGAMFAIKNLIDKSDLNTSQRLSRLKEMGIVEKLELYLNSSRESTRSSEEYAIHCLQLIR